MTATVATARRGLSDLAIRNLFVIPTIVFLILINIFPLFYSLFLSFADYSAISGKPPDFIGIQNYREILNDPHIWESLYVTVNWWSALVSRCY